MLSTKALLLTAACIIGLPAMANEKFAGKVTQQISGSVGRSPEVRPLSGATVIIGVDLRLDIGQTGTDTVHGKVIAKDVTESGSYSVNVPAGTYTVICWKQGYVPHVERGVRIPGNVDLDISKDTAGRGLHQHLSYK